MKILKNLLNKLSLSRNVLHEQIVKNDFSDSDKIARSIFSPINFKKNRQNLFTKATLNNNSFSSPAGKDEVSVNRLDYTTSNFVKKVSKIIEPINDCNRKYSGIAIIDVSEIKCAGAEINYTPLYIDNSKVRKFPNPFHADIKIGFVKEKGYPLPQEFSYKVSEMAKKCRYYPDPDPDEGSWTGDALN